MPNAPRSPVQLRSPRSCGCLTTGAKSRTSVRRRPPDRRLDALRGLRLLDAGGPFRPVVSRTPQPPFVQVRTGSVLCKSADRARLRRAAGPVRQELFLFLDFSEPSPGQGAHTPWETLRKIAIKARSG